MNEASPLINGHTSKTMPSPWIDRLWTALVTCVIMGIIGTAVIMSTENKHHIINNNNNNNSPQHGEFFTTTYRPVCKVVHPTRSVKVLQTSLGEPTEKWAPLECQRDPYADVDRYGAPDAVLQTDLKTHAIPSRPPILGFGGAFTEASALNFHTLTEEGQDTVLHLLFGELGYSLGRVHINSCDFSVESYAYDTVDGDFDLTQFSIQHDIDSGMVDFMSRAQKVHQKHWSGENFKLYASPWSPPAWLKAPTDGDKKTALHAENMTYSAQPVCLRDGVSPDSKYARTWALYFAKFLESYRDLGLEFFAITIQNEPEFPAPWEACSYTPETQAEFLANHLGPQLKQSFPNTKILIFDHNKDHAPIWIDTILRNPEAAQYVNGTAYHWYAGGMDRLLDGAQGTPNMHRVMAQLDVTLGKNNDHLILGSEACHCPYTGYAGGDINVAWARAERYAHAILADLAAGSQGWVEWNLILDSIGGPNHLGNLCDASLLAVPHRASGSKASPTQDFEHAGHPFGPVIGDGRTREELHALGFPGELLDKGIVAQPLFYYMGHISRYVRPGSRPVPALMLGASPFDGSGRGQAFRTVEGITGGGMNNLARVGIEMTLWPCEGSTRQQFHLHEGQIQVLGHDWLGVPTTSCVGNSNDKDYLGVMTGTCNATIGSPGSFRLQVVDDHDADEDSVQIMVTNALHKDKCLVLQELHNGGGANGPRGGAQVAVGDCDAGALSYWKYHDETGEIISSYFEDGDVCMTTGWPMLQVGAFDTPTSMDGKKTVVLLNEGGQSANYVLKDKESIVMTGSIPAHSIHTIIID